MDEGKDTICNMTPGHCHWKVVFKTRISSADFQMVPTLHRHMCAESVLFSCAQTQTKMTKIFAIVIAVIVALGLLAIAIDAIIRAIRIVVARINHDERTISRLTHGYDECEKLAFEHYGCSKELFAQYYKEVRERNSKALPWDALEFCAYEWDLLNNK